MSGTMYCELHTAYIFKDKYFKMNLIYCYEET
jgi:hypothetical protein